MDRQRIMEYTDAQRAVPGFKCETERQKEVFTNFYYAACSLIGGNENTLYDYDEDDEEYINAKKVLEDHAGLVDDVFAWGTSGFYGCGLEGPMQPYQKHYNFVGNDFMRRCAEAIVTAMGH
jgi:hypothetical protein